MLVGWWKRVQLPATQWLTMRRCTEPLPPRTPDRRVAVDAEAVDPHEGIEEIHEVAAER